RPAGPQPRDGLQRAQLPVVALRYPHSRATLSPGSLPVNVFRIKLLIVLFVGSLAGPFGVAGYLLVKSTRQPSAQPAGAGDGELLLSGERFPRDRDTEQAVVVYQRFLTANPRSPSAQLGLAHGELMAGRDDMAAQEFERALQPDPGNTMALLQLARIYSNRARTWPLAEARFRDYLALRPDDRDARLQSAPRLVLQGKGGGGGRAQTR